MGVIDPTMWTYSGDPSSSPKDNVRYIIGDTDPAYAYLTDKEIEFTLQENNGVIHQTALICVRRIIAIVAKEVDYKIGPEQVKASARLENFKGLLDQLQLEIDSAENVKVPSPGGCPPIFNKGMMDNRRGYFNIGPYY